MHRSKCSDWTEGTQVHNYIVEPILLVKLQGHYFHNGPVRFPEKIDRAIMEIMALLVFPGKLTNRAIMKISTVIMALLDQNVVLW